MNTTCPDCRAGLATVLQAAPMLIFVCPVHKNQYVLVVPRAELDAALAKIEELEQTIHFYELEIEDLERQANG